jgi:hypothetical protein
LPVAIPDAASHGTCVVIFAMKAPIQIAGQLRRPKYRMAQSAKPVGGHTGLTCSAVKAARKPIFAATTYAAPKASSGIRGTRRNLS